MRILDWRTEQSIQRVIESIHQNIGESITIDDMARTAMFSKFHFTRLFQRATGISPGRFLSAVRMEEAKKLLLTTSLSVTEITYRVGYNSVGTFSSRFKSSVGLSPTAYRELGGFTPVIPDEPRRHGRRTAIVQGRFVTPDAEETAGPVFAGLFLDTIPQGTPVKCTVLDRPGPFRLENVPEGRWYLLAQCVRPGGEETPDDLPPTVAVHGPMEIRPGTITKSLELRLRPMQVLDPPVLMALTNARRTALSTAAS
ncbi:helix-turn-helix domain-containing protein [Actinomadura alba]|uniref:Helix-turn-helix transcriptional regulator n=1 Tax=Actinomadura alba TaxID=406431 RepID=A0ABR7LRR7_9ACTN|nr:AraC family transcriptional regulator [Actinomadura alba]MBC6467522.1 helix-turn-helix transcriptional regulator [Actinomadura alba]